MNDDMEQYARLLGVLVVLEQVIVELAKAAPSADRERIVAMMEQIRADSGDSAHGTSRQETAQRIVRALES
jgi:hypothetical protein